MIKILRGTYSQLTSSTSILGEGQPAISTDTLDLRIGDGTKKYSQLPSLSNNQLTETVNELGTSITSKAERDVGTFTITNRYYMSLYFILTINKFAYLD